MRRSPEREEHALEGDGGSVSPNALARGRGWDANARVAACLVRWRPGQPLSEAVDEPVRLGVRSSRSNRRPFD